MRTILEDIMLCEHRDSRIMLVTLGVGEDEELLFTGCGASGELLV